jgi:hypothetical protein
VTDPGSLSLGLFEVSAALLALVWVIGAARFILLWAEKNLRPRSMRSLSGMLLWPRYSWLLSKAQRLAVQGKYGQALQRLRAAYGIFGWTVPSAKAPPAANVTVAVIARGLGDTRLAVNVFGALSSVTESPWSPVPKIEMMFLDYFRVVLADYIDRELGEPTVDESAIAAIRAMIDFRQISPDMLKSFTLWEQEACSHRANQGVV